MLAEAGFPPERRPRIFVCGSTGFVEGVARELVGTERRRGSIQSFYRATTTGWAELAETVEQMIGE